ncbi:hypothetical protein [Aureliella helgolandensis]|uniref:Uncharacterized protein n=1 Tax=Aureliella helgolandensis TaxID=2527968 RepID=A0A518G4W7_9BACT|nr:hypothetical protein [Aureliella helgolandensis]QDV23645.1 hypothetical protein Q31a_19490 [Aureliella helgolandensis]
MLQRASFILLCTALLLNSSTSLFGQEGTAGKSSNVWEATQRFPNVAVAKANDTSESARFSMLIPKNDIFTENVEQQYTISVPYTEELGDKTVTKNRVELRSRTIAVTRCGEMKMRRTTCELGDRTFRDLNGRILELTKLSGLSNPTHVIYGEQPDAYISAVLNPRVLVVEPQEADLSEGNSVALTREELSAPWFREEKVPTIAVAMTNSDKLWLLIPTVDPKKSPTATLQTQPALRMEKYELELSECTFQNLQHESLSRDEVLKRLEKPTHVVWESEVGGYLSAVLRPDVLLVNLKEGSDYGYTPDQLLVRKSQPEVVGGEHAEAPAKSSEASPAIAASIVGRNKKAVEAAAVKLRERLSQAPVEVSDAKTQKLKQFLSLIDVPVYLNITQLKSIGIDDSLELTTSAKVATLAEQLDAVLQPAELTWHLRGTVLVVTTIDDAFEHGEVCVYRMPPAVRDYSQLIQQVESLEPRKWLALGGAGDVFAFPPYMIVRQASHLQRKLQTSLRIKPLPHRYNAEMDEYLLSIEAKSNPLSEVCQQFQEQIGQEVAIDTNSLSQIGLVDPRITLSLAGVSASDALDLALNPIECTWVEKDGIITVVSQRDSARNLEKRLLPIPSLPVRDVSYLPAVIQKAVLPDEWQGLGGAGQISISGRRLTVSQSQPAIRQLEQFLGDLATTRR